MEMSEMTNEQQSRARELMHLYRQVHRSMTHVMRLQGDMLGLTPVQMMVIRTLAEESDLSLSELSERIQLGCSTVSGVVKRMVECGVLERDRLDEDQRTVSIRLTNKGQQLVEQAFGDNSLMTQALGKFLQLPQEDIHRLLELNRQLLHVLSVDK